MRRGEKRGKKEEQVTNLTKKKVRAAIDQNHLRKRKKKKRARSFFWCIGKGKKNTNKRHKRKTELI